MSESDQRTWFNLETNFYYGGGKRVRTADPLLARQVLSQLSYTPTSFVFFMVGLGGLEPPTSRLSGVRSNQLSYKPTYKKDSWSLKTKQQVQQPNSLYSLQIPLLASSASIL